MVLENILDEINKTKKIAEFDLNTVSQRAYPYKKGQVDNAKFKLENLYIKYKNEMMKRTVFIVTTGDQARTFAEISEKFNCFNVDADEFFVDIAKRVSPDIYMNKSINASVFDVLNNLIEDKMQALDIVSYNQLKFESKFQREMHNLNDFITVVKRSVTEGLGGEVIALDALEKVCQMAVNKGYKSRLVPVVLHSKDEHLINSLSSDIIKVNPRVVMVTAGETKIQRDNIINVENATENSVEKALKKIAGNA